MVERARFEVPLETARLCFRKWRADDLDLAVGLWGDPRMTEFIDARGALDRAQVKERLEDELLLDRKHGIRYWPIFCNRIWQSSGEHVGACGLRPYDLAREVYEIGAHLRVSYWGQGLAAEAMEAVIRFAFDTLGASALFAGHNPRNEASRRLLTRLGFRYTHDELYPPTGLHHPSYRLTPADRSPGS
jgi:[ribosomal protein S5]-alanine N-acetyltransferase